MEFNFAEGVVLGLLAGLVNGVFLLPMRYMKKWEWENTWLIFTILSTGVLPWVAALLAVPNLLSVFRSSPASVFIPGLVGGAIWGVAQVLYGLGLGMVGVAVGSAVVACTSTIAGTVGPMLVYAPERLFSSASLLLLLAIALILSGIYLYGKAGVRKEKETTGKDVAKQVVSGSFKTGLAICLVTGALGTAFVYGGEVKALMDAAVAAGAGSIFAKYPGFVVTFNAGMLPGVIYSIYKLNKNKTWSAYWKSGAVLWNLGSATVMAVLWYGGILMYGMSGKKIGAGMGPSIAFALFASGTVLFANLFGWLAGEWKGASRPTIRGFVIGMALVVAAILVIAFGVNRSG
ncbi:MAG TPA: L-rhamnose/proton symporter RhaT [Terriglobia bacterium]|nr:L-rhamnose/proton symporter RhaT [Terriglobia bacterium]